MEVGTIAAIISWFLGLASTYPIITSIATLIGTIVVLVSVLGPIIVKLTYWTNKDDIILEKIEDNVIFKALLKTLKSFSLYIPKK